MGGANTTLSTEGVVLEGVYVGDMQPSHRLENEGIAIYTVWPKVGKLVGRVGVTAQQQGEGHEGLKAVLRDGCDWVSNTAKSLWNQRGESEGFYGGWGQ